ncbi:hypothetical protein CGMCC3_g7941 [Colletotrichum fructicola]|nr:uncharacterized protein CGMCC3_g7941 [Colletotrichum fructicola]KAE9576038.1 hypothetical protein CGMCC3_g7941 [Colletotrichum fructicola]
MAGTTCLVEEAYDVFHILWSRIGGREATPGCKKRTVEDTYEFHDGCSRELKKAERLDDAKNQDKRMTDWDEPMQPAALAAICAITSSSILNISAVRANDLRKWENVEIVAWFINRWLGVNELSKIDEKLRDGSPGLFITTMLVYGAGASTIYHLNRNDRYQDTILAAGITLSVLLGQIVRIRLEDIILQIVPWMTLLALGVSTIYHRKAHEPPPKHNTPTDYLSKPISESI